MSGNKEMYNYKTDTYRKCKSAVTSYPSKQGFIKSLVRKRDSLRAMITDSENQTAVLRSAESALTAQIAELTKELNEGAERSK